MSRPKSLRERVIEFHEKFGQPVGPWVPHVPDEEMVRFRLSLITEEFFELLEAAGVWSGVPGAIDLVKNQLLKAFNVSMRGDVDLPAFVDAMADLDYVVEGTRIVMGVDGDHILEEVHRANMAKAPSPIVCVDCDPPSTSNEALVPTTNNELKCSKCGAGGLMFLGVPDRSKIKPAKPPSWTPPDIVGRLREQGWKGG